MNSQYHHDLSGQPTPYWRNVFMVMDQFPGPMVYITSFDKPMRDIVGGRVFQAPAKTAAQRIVEETHRLSTAEEIRAEIKRVEAEGIRLFNAEEDRKSTLRMRSTPEDDQRLASLIASTVKAVVDAGSGKSKGGSN